MPDFKLPLGLVISDFT